DRHIADGPDHGTGAAFILVQEGTGENAIVVTMGAAGQLTAADVEAAEDAIAGADVFATNCEVPVPVARRGLEIARAHGVPTILNPAPAVALPDAMFPLVDYLTPNESEAATLTGLPVDGANQAGAAAEALRAKGVGTVVVTLGAAGALIRSDAVRQTVPARPGGPVVDTTGAGDAFNGGFAVALAEGRDPVAAAAFGCAVAGLSVTRIGTAPSMPRRAEVEALLNR
ncbi:MAG: ribokinase, partial [Alphaproteobacteria bacterium]|nr:ribokinase [Alphaproteobacteria bacterium]